MEYYFDENERCNIAGHLTMAASVGFIERCNQLKIVNSIL